MELRYLARAVRVPASERSLNRAASDLVDGAGCSGPCLCDGRRAGKAAVRKAPEVGWLAGKTVSRAQDGRILRESA